MADNSSDQSRAVINPSGAMIQRRMISWTPEGLPVPTSVPTITKPALEELASVAMSLPYVPIAPKTMVPHSPEWEAWIEAEKKEFDGMTNAEVTLIKMARSAASGDQVAANALLDRILGRAKQSVESKRLDLTYEDYLKEKAANLAASRPRTHESFSSRADEAEVVDDGMEGVMEGLL